MTDLPKILVIDDTPANLATLGAALARDFDLQIATSGAMGLALALQSPPDLILLDVMMPDMDGYETCRRFKADSRLRAIPVIFVTALADEHSESAGLALGAADYIAKPINVDIARQRIRNLLEREQLRKNLEANETILEGLVCRRTAELEETVAELETLLYSLSHDLRAPLRAINGFAAMLVDGEGRNLSGEGKAQLARIAMNATRLGDLIDDVQEYARLSREPMTTSTVALGTVVESVAAEFVDRYPRAQFLIDPLPDVKGDPEMLRRLIRLLLDNACKFSGNKEHPVIEIGVERQGNDERFFVKDNGAGFDMQFVGKLFHMFQRLHHESEFPGRGVGLAIAKRLIDRHGGRILAEAKVGIGATLYFTFGKS